MVFILQGCDSIDTSGTITLDVSNEEPAFWGHQINAFRTSYGYADASQYICSTADNFLYQNDGNNLPTGNVITADDGTAVTCEPLTVYQIFTVERVDTQLIDLSRVSPVDLTTFY